MDYPTDDPDTMNLVIAKEVEAILDRFIEARYTNQMVLYIIANLIPTFIGREERKLWKPITLRLIGYIEESLKVLFKGKPMIIPKEN